MNKKTVSKFQIPEELKDVATTGDVNALEQRVDKCFSTERYEDFQEAVEKIVLRKIDSGEGGEKIKKHAEDYFKGKVVWVIIVWLATIIGSAIIQKYFKIF